MQGRFLIGLEHKGKLHFHFKVRPLTMGAELKALEAIDELEIALDSANRGDKMLIDLAFLSQQLDIEGIAESEINAPFLLEKLAVDDYWWVQETIKELKKKRIAAGESPNPAEV